MTPAVTKLPVKTENKAAQPPSTLSDWHPFETLRREIDRLFDGFPGARGLGLSTRFPFDVEPLWRRDAAWGAAPMVDIVEKENAYEITAELPGMTADDIEVKLAHDMLTITGEKKEEKEEKKKDYYLSERRYGSFQRTFQMPEGIDPDKIAASVEKGVLNIVLPKTAQAQKQERKIAISAK
jgi:HSP20 family protein